MNALTEYYKKELGIAAEYSPKPIDLIPPIKVEGTLIDFATGKPIEGANVYVKQDPKTGSATTAKGSFSLQANPHHTIVFSHQSYGVEEWTAQDVGSTVYMAEKANQLDEVVITNQPKTKWLKYAGFGLLGLLIIAGLTRKKQ